MGHLAEYLKKTRLDKKWNLQHFAKELGYKNLNRGARRLAQLERDGVGNKSLLAKMIEVLDLDLQTVANLQNKDKLDRIKEREAYIKEWEIWADEPVPMQLIVRYMAAAYFKRQIPETIVDRESAITFAKNIAIEEARKVCLVLSRRESMWIDEKGRDIIKKSSPDEINSPYMQIK